MNGNEITQIVAPIVAAFVGGGGIVAYYNYKAGKPKTAAEAQKLQADVVVTFAEGWKQYSEKLESRLNIAEQQITNMQASIAEQDRKNRETLAQKDAQISDLQTKNRQLEIRVNDLEAELTKYKKTESKIDAVRENLHTDVDKNLDTIKK